MKYYTVTTMLEVSYTVELPDDVDEWEFANRLTDWTAEAYDDAIDVEVFDVYPSQVLDIYGARYE